VGELLQLKDGLYLKLCLHNTHSLMKERGANIFDIGSKEGTFNEV
jgi:hypothetical protein